MSSTRTYIHLRDPYQVRLTRTMAHGSDKGSLTLSLGGHEVTIFGTSSDMVALRAAVSEGVATVLIQIAADTGCDDDTDD